MPLVTRFVVKSSPTHKQSGHRDTAESSSHGVIFCSAAGPNYISLIYPPKEENLSPLISFFPF